MEKIANNLGANTNEADESESKTTATADDENETEQLVEEKEQVYPKLKSKIEILDVLFHPTESNLISIGLINGKLKM